MGVCDKMSADDVSGDVMYGWGFIWDSDINVSSCAMEDFGVTLDIDEAGMSSKARKFRI